tara:strand:- start:4490 stop:5434 length:945 start_codon:yes stop_codon:yes gene_type:complete
MEMNNMATMNLNQILGQNLQADAVVAPADGPFTKQDSVLQQTLRDFIQLQSTTIAVGTKIVGLRTVPWMTYKWYSGAQGSFTFPIDDNAVVDPTNIGTANYTVALEKGQGRTVFLDSVRLRGERFETLDRQQLAIVQARASTIDNHILSNVYAGAGQTQAVTAGVWTGATNDAERDTLLTMDLIFQNARTSGDEPLAMVLPATCRSTLLNTSLYGNVIESLETHLGRIARLSVLYTRDTAAMGGNDAILMIPGAETAEFFQYNGAGFMETEITRMEGVGYSYLLTSYMGTVVHQQQDGSGNGLSNRIATITGVI